MRDEIESWDVATLSVDINACAEVLDLIRCDSGAEEKAPYHRFSPEEII